MISTIDLFPSKLILCQMSQNAGSSEKVQTVVLFYWTGMFYVGMKTFKHVNFLSTFWTLLA